MFFLVSCRLFLKPVPEGSENVPRSKVELAKNGYTQKNIFSLAI
jgi:hypothetical protein